MIKLTQLKQNDILFDHAEGSILSDPMLFVCKAIQSITESKWNHVKTIYKIEEPTPDGIYISEAAPSGYVMHTLRESTDSGTVETFVSRYCAYNLGGRELNAEDNKKLFDWDNKRLSEGIPYGFVQIAQLAILKQFRNDSTIGMALGITFERFQQEVEKYGKQFICSEATYRRYFENGFDIGVLKDSKHMSHYTSEGDILERYKLDGKDLLNPVIADWISPHDVYESIRIIGLDYLDLRWRNK